MAKNIVRTVGVAAHMNLTNGSGANKLSGQLVAFGALRVALLLEDTLNGAEAPAVHEGVEIRYPAVALQAWTEGVQLYWDPTTDKLTTGATNNIPAGKASRAKANDAAATSGYCLLNA